MVHDGGGAVALFGAHRVPVRAPCKRCAPIQPLRIPPNQHRSRPPPGGGGLTNRGTAKERVAVKEKKVETELCPWEERVEGVGGVARLP